MDEPIKSIFFTFLFAGPSLAYGLARIFDFEKNVKINLYYLLIVVIFLVSILKIYRSNWRFEQVGWSLCLVFIVATFTTGIATVESGRGDLSSMWGQLFMAYIPVLLLLSCQIFVASNDIEKPIAMAMFYLIFVSCSSVLLEYFSLTQFESYGSRHFGFMGDGVSWLLSLISVYYFIKSKWIYELFSLTALFITASRAPIAITFVSLLLYFIFSKKIGNGRFLAYLIMPVIILIAINYWNSEILTTFFDRLNQTNMNDNDRINTSNITLSIFYLSPIFGSGFNAQFYYYPPPSDGQAIGEFNIPTSTALQTLSDGGVCLFAVYIYAMLTISLLCIKSLRSSNNTPEYITLKIFSSWLLCYIWLNHTAAWLLPYSYISTIVFSSIGILYVSVNRNQKSLPLTVQKFSVIN